MALNKHKIDRKTARVLVEKHGFRIEHTEGKKWNLKKSVGGFEVVAKSNGEFYFTPTEALFNEGDYKPKKLQKIVRDLEEEGYISKQ